MARTALICRGAGAAIVDAATAKKNLNEESADWDALLDSLCATATAMLDGADGHLKRALLSQTWTLVLRSFYECDEYGRIWLPLPPIIAVTAVKYLDTSGVEQTLSSSVYRLVNNGTEASYLTLVLGQAWPAHGCFEDAVRIEFTAGYGTDADDVPAPIRQAALLNIAHLFQFRGDDQSAPEMPMAAKNLVANYRIIRG